MKQKKLSEASQRALQLQDKVLDEWERRVRAHVGHANGLSHPVLVDTLPAYYQRLVESFSPDLAKLSGINATTIASEHGGERARLTHYDPESVIHEYQLFRAALFDVLDENGVRLDRQQVRLVNASIDASIREAVSAFSLVAAALREQFVAALAHDIRSPLSTSSMVAELIAHLSDSSKIRDLAGKLLETNQKIEGMIENFLDAVVFQRGEHLRISLTWFDIQDVVKEVVEQYSSSEPNTRIDIEGGPVLGWWGREELRRALDNLVSNAIKYGQKAGPITVKFGTAYDRLVLSVHNEGQAIPVEEQEGVFQVFRRAQQAKDSTQRGWGIGLPYVRAVAESHGGNVGIESTQGRGTTFLIDIPVDARPHQGAPTTVPGR